MLPCFRWLGRPRSKSLKKLAFSVIFSTNKKRRSWTELIEIDWGFKLKRYFTVGKWFLYPPENCIFLCYGSPWLIHSRAVFLHFLNPGVRTRFVKTFGRNPRTVFRAEESLFDAGLEIQKSFKRVISRKESYQQDISISKAQSKTFGLRTFVQNPDIIQCCFKWICGKHGAAEGSENYRNTFFALFASLWFASAPNVCIYMHDMYDICVLCFLYI